MAADITRMTVLRHTGSGTGRGFDLAPNCRYQSWTDLGAQPLFNRFAAIAGLCLALAGPANADWREEMGSFRVAVAAAQDAQATAARIEPFRLALEQALGLPVEIVTMRDYPAIIDAAARSRIEYAILSASAHAAAYASCECVEPLVTATLANGGSAFTQQLIGRSDGPADLAALGGRKIAVVETGSVGGVMLAGHALRKAGLDLEGGAATLLPFPDTGAAIRALADGSADALLGWSSAATDPRTGASPGTLRQISELGGATFKTRVLWESSPIPHRVHAVRKSLAGEAKTILRSLLGSLFDTDPVAYDAVEPDFGGGFLAARQSQFQQLVDMFRQAGLSIKFEDR
jgi:phosphonate transport system substrate-binding protein